MKYLLTALLSLVYSNAPAFDLENHKYNDFEGTIDNKHQIYISLYPSEDGTIKGHYFYKNDEKKINLIGKYRQDKISLEELDQNGVTFSATFEGKLSTDDRDRFRGLKTTITTRNSLDFNLSLAAVGSADWGRRYSAMGAESDEEVEIFAGKIKQAIFLSNYEWLSNQISYPINLSIKGKQKKIKNKAAFLKFAPIAFTSLFKNKLFKYRTIDMFSNSTGVMIGTGEIWMSYVGNKVNGLFTLKVIGINN